MAARRSALAPLALALALAARPAPNTAAAATNASPTLTARDLFRMTGPEAARRLPARLTGTLLAFDPDNGRLFLDADGVPLAANANWQTTQESRRRIPSLQPGDILEIDGITTGGGVTAFLAGSKERPLSFRVLARGPLPEPARPPPQDMLSLSHHGRWSEIRAYVESIEDAPKGPRLTLIAAGRRFTARVAPFAGPPPAPLRLAGSDVRLRGVPILVPQDRQSWSRTEWLVPGPGFLDIVDRDLAAAFQQPSLDARGLWRHAGTAERVRVRGVILAAIPGRGFHMRTGDAALWVESLLASAIPPGTRADAAGFATTENNRPALADAVTRPLGRPQPVEPVPIPPGGQPGHRHDGDLVRMEAMLADRIEREGRPLYLMRAGNISFYAQPLDPASQASWPAPRLESWLALTGICGINSAPGTGAPGPGAPAPFTLYLRGPDDLTVVHLPPFWNTQRALSVAATLLAATLATLAWAALLKRQVRRQTQVIAENLDRQKIAAERARIARELHDSLEQNLAAIAIQSGLAASQATTQPERARASLGTLIALVRRAQEEARHAVWQLRSPRTGQGDLPGAFRDWLAAALPGQNIAFQIEGDPRPVPPTAAQHILRAGQEAVTNALKHANATRIAIGLAFANGAVRLTVTDNGKGFDPAAPTAAPPGHFGLLGMRERAERLRGQLDIASQPGQGTRVVLTAPLPPGNTTPP